MPIADEAAVLPDGGDVVFDLRTRALARGSVRVVVATEHGEAPAEVEVRVWQLATQRGVTLERVRDGAFAAHALRAGHYRVLVGAAAHGWLELPPVYVDGTGTTELGTVRLPAPATLVLGDRAARPGLELYACRGGCDVRADELAPAVEHVLLPGGAWLAVWRDAAAATGVRAATFTLASGRTLRLDDVR